MLHPQAQAFLDLLVSKGVPPTHTLTVADARKFYRERRAVTQPAPPEVAEVRDLSAEGPEGAIPLRLYRPLGSKAGAVLPVLVYYHGGGWTIGDLDTHVRDSEAVGDAALEQGQVDGEVLLEGIELEAMRVAGAAAGGQREQREVRREGGVVERLQPQHARSRALANDGVAAALLDRLEREHGRRIGEHLEVARGGEHRVLIDLAELRRHLHLRPAMLDLGRLRRGLFHLRRGLGRAATGENDEQQDSRSLSHRLHALSTLAAITMRWICEVPS